MAKFISFYFIRRKKKGFYRYDGCPLSYKKPNEKKYTRVFLLSFKLLLKTSYLLLQSIFARN